MKVITTNLLNRFWKNGVKPIKDDVAKKLNTSNIINNLLATAAGYALDARQGKILNDKITELNGKIVTSDYVQLGSAPSTTVTVTVDNITKYKEVVLFNNYVSGYYANPVRVNIALFKAMSYIVSDRRDANKSYTAIAHYISDTQVQLIGTNTNAVLYGIK